MAAKVDCKGTKIIYEVLLEFVTRAVVVVVQWLGSWV